MYTNTKNESRCLFLMAASNWSVTARLVGSGRKVEARVAIKESVGHELEASGDDRLDGKVLQTDGVVQSKCVPGHNVLVLGGTPLLGPNTQAVASVRVVHKMACRVALVRIVGCHPKLLVDERHALARRTVGMRVCTNAVKRLKLVGSWFTHAVGLLAAGKFPVAFLLGVTLVATFGCDGSLLNEISVSVWIDFRIVRFLNRIALLDSVLISIDTQVETSTEVVLVDLSKDTRHDFSTVLAALSRLAGGGVDDPGCLHFELNRTIQVEVPIATCLYKRLEACISHDK